MNERITREDLEIYDRNSPAHVNGDRDTITMVASDVVALYPSLETRQTARICGEMVEKSTLQFQNLDYREMLLYIRLNKDKVTGLGELENFLPRRAFKFGRAPGMKNTMRGPHHQRDVKEEEAKWIHQPTPVSDRLKRKILGKVTEIGIITLFTTFVYTFGGDLCYI